MKQSDYLKINNSFRRDCTFRLGDYAGFFSELNHMILAMVFCLDKGIKFNLYSKYSNFGFDNGFADYFIPFIDEKKSVFHKKYNHRPSNKRKMPLWYRAKRRMFKSQLLTQDIWQDLRNYRLIEGELCFEHLNIGGGLYEVCSDFVRMIWKFNDSTEKHIDGRIKGLNMPDDYIGVHIRRGDKINECSYIPLSEYMKHIESVTNIKEIFIATDSFEVIDEAKINYPDYNFYSFEDPNNNGYDQNEFAALNADDKRLYMLDFFSSIEAICKSNYFIGSYTSNVGAFIAMYKGLENCHSVDNRKWSLY